MSVIDPDSRQVVTSMGSPWNAVVRIKSMASSGIPRYGTGWLISPSRLVTAGHVIHHKAMLGGLAHSVEVELDGETQAASGWRVHPRWENDSDFALDVGFVELAGPFGTAFSSLDLEVMQPVDLSGPTVIAGYPFHPFESRPRWAKGRVVHWHEGLAYHDVDTSSGQSGGPLLRQGGLVAVGIHTPDTGANALSKALGANVAVPLSTQLIAFLNG